MAAEPAEGMYRCANRNLLTEDGDRFLSVHDHSAQGAMSLVTYEQHRRAGQCEIVPKVVQDAPAGAHARAGHDQAWALDVVKRSRIIRRRAELRGLQLLAKFAGFLHGQRFVIDNSTCLAYSFVASIAIGLSM